MSEKNVELYNKLSDHILHATDKFIYYILGVSAASIAYTIHFILGNLKSNNIGILLVSILLWAISFAVGVKAILMQTQLISLNQHRLKGGATDRELLAYNNKLANHIRIVLIFFGLAFVPYLYWIVVILFFQN